MCTGGEDFVDDSGIVLEFQPGDTIQCINITILDDAFLEFEECFYVDLVSDIAGFETSTTKIVINDDEGGVLSQLFICHNNQYSFSSFQKSLSMLSRRSTRLLRAMNWRFALLQLMVFQQCSHSMLMLTFLVRYH